MDYNSSLANNIIRLTGSKSNIVYKDLPEDDPKEEVQILIT